MCQSIQKPGEVGQKKNVKERARESEREIERSGKIQDEIKQPVLICFSFYKFLDRERISNIILCRFFWKDWMRILVKNLLYVQKNISDVK